MIPETETNVSKTTPIGNPCTHNQSLSDNILPRGTGENAVDDHMAMSDADEQFAALLVRMWSLASGRRLRPDVRPDQLSMDELIAFWADDFTQSSGRHAAPGPLHARAAA